MYLLYASKEVLILRINFVIVIVMSQILYHRYYVSDAISHILCLRYYITDTMCQIPCFCNNV